MSSESAPCGNNCVSNQTQAVGYMQNETLWMLVIVRAWQEPPIMAALTKLAQSGADATPFLREQAAHFKLDNCNFVPGVQTVIVLDQVDKVHLILPAVQNIPARGVDMVPHAF
jgi:hypothetical protein